MVVNVAGEKLWLYFKVGLYLRDNKERIVTLQGGCVVSSGGWLSIQFSKDSF